MRNLFVLLFIAVIFSCSSQKNVLNSWMGMPKQKLILSWGPPIRTADDGNGGEILIYAKRTYVQQYGWNWWDYKMMYANNEGTLYHWRTSREHVPPTEVVVSFR